MIGVVFPLEFQPTSEVILTQIFASRFHLRLPFLVLKR